MCMTDSDLHLYGASSGEVPTTPPTETLDGNKIVVLPGGAVTQSGHIVRVRVAASSAFSITILVSILNTLTTD